MDSIPSTASFVGGMAGGPAGTQIHQHFHQHNHNQRNQWNTQNTIVNKNLLIVEHPGKGASFAAQKQASMNKGPLSTYAGGPKNFEDFEDFLSNDLNGNFDRTNFDSYLSIDDDFLSKQRIQSDFKNASLLQASPRKKVNLFTNDFFAGFQEDAFQAHGGSLGAHGRGGMSGTHEHPRASESFNFNFLC